MVMNVVEEHSGSIFTGRQGTEIVYSDVKSSEPTNQITSSHNLEYYNFEA